MLTTNQVFAVYDMIGLYLHFASGPAVAIARFVTSYFDFAVAFGRLDAAIVEESLLRFDPGYVSFASMAMLDFAFNSPITSTLSRMLNEELRGRRVESKETRNRFKGKEEQLDAFLKRRKVGGPWGSALTLSANDLSWAALEADLHSLDVRDAERFKAGRPDAEGGV